jgi:tetratricopeptide (TPR) repeat protein
VQFLEKRLAEMMAGWRDDSAAARTMDAREIARLAALGYVAVSAGSQPDELVDPKDRVPKLARLTDARRLMERGRVADALVELRALVDQTPGAEEPVFAIADAYVLLGRRHEAARELSRHADAYPSAAILVRLAAELLALGRFREMESALGRAEQLDPLCGLISVLRGDRCYVDERYREAAANYARALEIDADRLGPELQQKLAETRRLAEQQRP